LTASMIVHRRKLAAVCTAASATSVYESRIFRVCSGDHPPVAPYVLSRLFADTRPAYPTTAPPATPTTERESSAGTRSRRTFRRGVGGAQGRHNTPHPTSAWLNTGSFLDTPPNTFGICIASAQRPDLSVRAEDRHSQSSLRLHLTAPHHPMHHLCCCRLYPAAPTAGRDRCPCRRRSGFLVYPNPLLLALIHSPAPLLAQL
jgi:hypothetical protein